mmetsp:Transcript_15525/g.36888  ORF Transcript_15525/g.36888 Transcript_15525/m.36888 type:complete len:490 (-) Transcript_15525:242-1711(-)
MVGKPTKGTKETPSGRTSPPAGAGAGAVRQTGIGARLAPRTRPPDAPHAAMTGSSAARATASIMTGQGALKSSGPVRTHGPGGRDLCRRTIPATGTTRQQEAPRATPMGMSSREGVGAPSGMATAGITAERSAMSAALAEGAPGNGIGPAVTARGRPSGLGSMLAGRRGTTSPPRSLIHGSEISVRHHREGIAQTGTSSGGCGSRTRMGGPRPAGPASAGGGPRSLSRCVAARQQGLRPPGGRKTTSSLRDHTRGGGRRRRRPMRHQPERATGHTANRGGMRRTRAGRPSRGGAAPRRRSRWGGRRVATAGCTTAGMAHPRGHTRPLCATGRLPRGRTRPLCGVGRLPRGRTRPLCGGTPMATGRGGPVGAAGTRGLRRFPTGGRRSLSGPPRRCAATEITGRVEGALHAAAATSLVAPAGEGRGSETTAGRGRGPPSTTPATGAGPRKAPRRWTVMGGRGIPLAHGRSLETRRRRAGGRRHVEEGGSR